MDSKEKEKSCEELILIAKKMTKKDIEKITDIATGIVLVREADTKKEKVQMG